MNSSFSYVILLVLVVTSILKSDATGICFCTCCAGINCNATLQGTIDVDTCVGPSCEKACRNKYPQRCVQDSGRSSFQCVERSTSSGNKANWIGTFVINKKCNQNTCCCPADKLVLSNADENLIRVKASFAGKACPNGLSSIDETFDMPDGYAFTVDFLNNPIRVTLRADGNEIEMKNEKFPACTETATRNEDSTVITPVRTTTNQSGLSTRMNLGVLSSVVALMIIEHLLV